ncbi:MAG TPA: HmuY family protein [Gemmatimonadaceae bacterium]|nr:HmuY family protein [Gemmatimonadaceae bacterium]
MNSEFRRLLRPSIATALLALAACDTVTDPPGAVAGEFTVDASSKWTYVSLADSAIVTPSPSGRESSAWDIAFFSTNVTLNGGAAGPGGVTGACLCQNAGATDAQVLAMTAASGKADFDAVTSLPAGTTFSADALTPAMSGWYTGAGASAAANAGKIFLVRLSDGVSYAKVHVTAIAGATAASAGQVTLEYAVQPSATAAFGPTTSITLGSTAATAAADLNANTLTSAATSWDIRLDGWNLLVNGGISGPGMTAVAPPETSASFAATTTAVTAPQAYRADTYAGIFAAKRWYRYNIAGDNRISPTFDVYLIRRGNDVYKLQVTNYYSATGVPRQITFRYQRIGS